MLAMTTKLFRAKLGLDGNGRVLTQVAFRVSLW